MFKNWKNLQHFISLEGAKASMSTPEGHRWASLM